MPLELSTAGGVDEWTFMLMANDDSDTQTESADFELSAQADLLNEAGASVRRIFFNRTFRLTINPAGTVVVPALSVAAAPTTITEGAASTITITAATAPADDLTIPYTIAGTGIATGDYTLTDASGTELTGLTGNITLAGSATSVALTLTAADDSDASAEMLTFTLGAGTGYTVATATATITIDPAVAATLPTVQFSAATTATVAEGDGTVVLTLELSEAVTEEFQVTVNTNGLTASFRDDYMSAGSVIFAVGDTMQTVSIPIVDDDVVETDETFRASISALDPAYTAVVMLGTRLFVTVTITDDDEPTPALSVAAAPTTITEGAASTITITATSAPADDLTIPYTIDGTGIAVGDYTLADAERHGTNRINGEHHLSRQRHIGSVDTDSGGRFGRISRDADLHIGDGYRLHPDHGHSNDNDQSDRDGDSAGLVGGRSPDLHNGRRGEYDHDHSGHRTGG